MKVPYLYTGIN